MSKHYRKENNCLNCGKVVEGKFCSNCGQENIEIREPFWAFVSHGIAHYFHYDSKFKQTLKPFLTKPGQLTVDYIQGRRASHIPPISLYLFITLVYFLFAPVFKGSSKNGGTDYKRNPARTYSYSSGDKNFPTDSITSSDSEEKPSEIDKLDSELKDSGDSASNLVKTLKNLNNERGHSTVESYRRRQAQLNEAEKDNVIIRFWTEKAISYKRKTGHDLDISEIGDKYFPKLLFILMPLFAFFLMLNLRKNKKLYMEHLIYTIHLFSFAYLTFFLSEMLSFITPRGVGEFISFIFFGILVWYTYRSIRVVYQRPRWVTIRKLFSVSILFLIAFILTYTIGAAVIVVLT